MSISIFTMMIILPKARNLVLHIVTFIIPIISIQRLTVKHNGTHIADIWFIDHPSLNGTGPDNYEEDMCKVRHKMLLHPYQQ